jgi:hypothetical protein
MCLRCLILDISGTRSFGGMGRGYLSRAAVDIDALPLIARENCRLLGKFNLQMWSNGQVARLDCGSVHRDLRLPPRMGNTARYSRAGGLSWKTRRSGWRLDGLIPIGLTGGVGRRALRILYQPDESVVQVKHLISAISPASHTFEERTRQAAKLLPKSSLG